MPESDLKKASAKTVLKLRKILRSIVLIPNRFLALITKASKSLKSSVTIAALVTMAILAGHTVSAQVSPPSQPLGSLKSVAIPEPSNLGEFVKNKTAAI